MRISTKQYGKMIDTPVEKLVLSLAAPTILSMLITSIYNLADTFFVGRISTSASGAIGVVSSLMSVIQALGFMLGHGSGSIISRSLGGGDTEKASRYTSTSFFAALAFGFMLAIGGLCFLNPLMGLLGSTETILPHAAAYARYILIAAPVMMSSLVLNNILRYEGKANIAMIGLVTGGLVNIALDPLFIFALGMGTGGAGAATALSQCVSFAILLSMFLSGKTVSKINPRLVTRRARDFLSILVTGLPSFGRQGLGSIATMTLNVAARSYGDAAVAGMSIVSRIFMFIMAVVIGIGQGFQPVAGFNYGAGRYDRVRKACLFTIAAGTCAVIVISGGCFIAAQPLIKLFRDDAAVMAVALPAFRWQCMALILQPTVTGTNMMFQSVGKSARATLIACCRQGVCFMPLILTLPQIWGIAGVEAAQPIADVMTFVITLPFLIAFLRELGESKAASAALEGAAK